MSIASEYWEDLEVIRVETPENLELVFPLAGIGPRFIALLIDTLIQIAASAILFFVLIAIGMAVDLGVGDVEGMTVILAMVFGAIAIFIGYPVLFEWIWNGQTPGKRTAGIRVVSTGGLPLEFRQVLVRNLFRLVDYFPSHGFTGLISFLVTKHQQRLGDLVTGTIVIREFRSASPFNWPGSGSAHYPAPGEGTLTPRLSYTIGAYLVRNRFFAIETKMELTAEIIRQLGYEPDQMLLRDREAYLSSLLQYQAGNPA